MFGDNTDNTKSTTVALAQCPCSVFSVRFRSILGFCPVVPPPCSQLLPPAQRELSPRDTRVPCAPPPLACKHCSAFCVSKSDLGGVSWEWGSAVFVFCDRLPLLSTRSSRVITEQQVSEGPSFLRLRRVLGSAVTLEGRLGVSYKTKHTLTIQSSNRTPRSTPPDRPATGLTGFRWRFPRGVRSEASFLF